MFSTKEVAAYYHVTEQTIRTWAVEFADYLSPLANPGMGKSRTYSTDDFTVFSLVAELKKQNKTFEDIHMMLRSGQRGDPPDLNETDLKVLSATEGEKRAVLEIQALQQHVIDLKERLRRAEEKAVQSEELSRTNAGLEATVHLLREEVERLRLQLEQSQEKNLDLARQSGERQGSGFVEGYKAGLKDAKSSEDE